MMNDSAGVSDWRRVVFSNRLMVHPGAGRAARHARALTGSSDWRRGLVDRAGAALVAISGPRTMPRSPEPFWPAADIDHICAALSDPLPGLRVLGAVVPRQHGRRRLSMLARISGNLVVVKLGSDDDLLDREATVLGLLARDPLPGIATPRPIASGTVDIDGQAVTYLASTSIALERQRPAIDARLRTFERDLAERLGSLPRPNLVGHDLIPIHGDLTPWNLRQTSRGLALFDWEAAGWGPRGSDLETYRAASAAVRPWWRGRR